MHFHWESIGFAYTGGINVTLQQLRYVIAIEQNGSFSKAAKSLFVSQPSISALVADLEQELDIAIFERTSKGVILSADGKEFLKYAHQLVDESDAIKEYFREHKNNQPVFFSVSSQHYSFAIRAFIDLEQSVNHSRYVLRLKETQTLTVIEDVAKQRSEVGIIFLSDFSDRHIRKVLYNNNLVFHELVSTAPHVFVHKSHPLAGRDALGVEDLEAYPCVIYDQHDNIPFYFSEELTIATYRPSKILYASDLYVSVCMMRDCGAYNIGTGILSPGLALDDIVSVPMVGQEPMVVGWIALQNHQLSDLGDRFIQIVMQYLPTDCLAIG